MDVNQNYLTSVGAYSHSASPYGTFDQAGNVWEWNVDFNASSYPTGTCNNCATITSSSNRVFRGGDFSIDASSLLASYRSANPPTSRGGGIGARCARTP